MVVGLVIPIYMILNIASFGYYWRFARTEFNWLKHVHHPDARRARVRLPVPRRYWGWRWSRSSRRSTPPISYAGPVVIALYVIGLIVVIYHWQAHPERVIAMGKTLGDDGTIGGEANTAGGDSGVVAG